MLNKNLQTCKTNHKEKLKMSYSNYLIKSYKKNKNKANNNNNNNINTNTNSNTQELSDIKTIVKNSVEKIYDLFNLKEMKENSKILKRKSNEKNIIKENNNNKKSDNDSMKANIKDYFNVNKNINIFRNNDENNYGKTYFLEDESSYLYKTYKIDEKKNISNDINNIYNLKKNTHKKELIKNNSSNYNFMKKKTNIKHNILISSKYNNKLTNIIDNYYSDKNLIINYENKDNNFFNESIDNINEDIKSNILDKSIIVNTKYKKEDININDYIIKPTRISHINKLNESSLTNDIIINQSKDGKLNSDSKIKNKNNTEKKKKYMFLKRTKKKNNIGNEDEKSKNKMVLIQNNSPIKYQLSDLRMNNKLNNLYNTRSEFYLRKENLFKDKNNKNKKEFKKEYNNKKQNNIHSKNNAFINISNKKKSNIHIYNSSTKRNNEKKINISKQYKYLQTTNRSININNNLLISNSNCPHYLSKKSKSDNKLIISLKQNIRKNNNKKLILEKDIKNNTSRNKNQIYSSKINKEDKKLNFKEKKIFSKSFNKLLNKKKKNNQGKTLGKLNDTKFKNLLTNDIIKLFLLLNEYIINNNLLSDYLLNNNKDILNKLSELLSKNCFIDYPKEFDIKMDNYINKVKIIQRSWRKYKMKHLLENNEEIQELKKIIVNNYITKAGYKITKIIGLFNSMIEDFNDIKNTDDINKMFFYVKNLIKRDLTSYEKNMIYKEFINNFICSNKIV